MDYTTEFAKKINSKTNISRIGNSKGTVLSIRPLKISISGGSVILDDSNCYLCSNLVENLTGTVVINGVDTTVTFNNSLKINDTVLAISDIRGQKFFITDKVVI
ncbi:MULTISPECIES: DUF2577 family protein [Clostridium]|uniref:DUF2577 family protein n=1 Tax=Clostridium frigoriphilum TaxID=443253 RepID=A0ABU7UU48_9CLOT|nr:DUF2577 family protein [Clostridium sp. DSM 17811]MBU3098750.1 DUF2577 domain-containing protein [Clostridium sp. DSM 17811]